MQVRLAAGAGAGMAVSVIFWVTFLLVKLWVEKDRYEISLKKALGFTTMEIKKTYFAKFTVITILAALAGIVSGHCKRTLSGAESPRDHTAFYGGCRLSLPD